MKKTIKDLKPGDNLYFLDDSSRYSASSRRVISIEEYPEDPEFLKITWEESDYYTVFPNYCVCREDDTMFFEEVDYDSDNYNEDDYEEDGCTVFVNKEDIISRLEGEINRLHQEIEDLNGKED